MKLSSHDPLEDLIQKIITDNKQSSVIDLDDMFNSLEFYNDYYLYKKGSDIKLRDYSIDSYIIAKCILICRDHFEKKKLNKDIFEKIDFFSREYYYKSEFLQFIFDYKKLVDEKLLGE